MANYRQDPENSKKQRPGGLPDNAYERTKVPTVGTLTKTPSYVLVTKTMTKPWGFFFGSSASFATEAATQIGFPKHAGATSHRLDGPTSASLITSSFYQSFGQPAAGTQLNIHPIAYSCSKADNEKIVFVYNSGLSTGAR